MHVIRVFLQDESQTNRLAELMASHWTPGYCYYFIGELGAGKTTMIRAFLHKVGVTGKIKSPTFSIMETYQLGQFHFHHLDCYRIVDEEEILCLGLDDYADENATWLVEWPEKAGNAIPEPDIILVFSPYGQGRIVEIRARFPMDYIHVEEFGS